MSASVMLHRTVKQLFRSYIGTKNVLSATKDRRVQLIEKTNKLVVSKIRQQAGVAGVGGVLKGATLIGSGFMPSEPWQSGVKAASEFLGGAENVVATLIRAEETKQQQKLSLDREHRLMEDREATSHVGQDWDSIKGSTDKVDEKEEQLFRV